MDQLHYQALLNQVSTLTAHYDKLAGLTGENFNVFRILKLETAEVRMHSAFLAALLDPQGNHGQKDRFMRLFIDRFCYKQNTFYTTSAKVKIEMHTGFINEDRSEGGRIDIVITDSQNKPQVIIENKIYAGDQGNQLIRYHNHSPDADLLYLTLTGKEPSKESCGNLENNVHYRCCSYKSDILSWLEDCRKEAAVFPVIRESITQYIHLIKHLTNQTLNDTMATELNQIMKNNLAASFKITENLDNTCREIFNDFFIQLSDLCKTSGLNCGNNFDWNKNNTGIWIGRPEWRYLNIGFQFRRYDKDMVYGLAVTREAHSNGVPIALRDKIRSLSNNLSKTDSWFYWSQYMDAPYDDWSKHEAWDSLMNGSMLSVMKEKLDQLLNLVKDMEL